MSDDLDAMAYWAAARKDIGVRQTPSSHVMSSVDSSYFGWADRRVHLEVIEAWARRYGGVDRVAVDAGLKRSNAEVEWALVGHEDGRGPLCLLLTVRDVRFAEVISDRLKELGLAKPAKPRPSFVGLIPV